MRVKKTSLLGSVVCWGVLLLTAPVRAGGPLIFNEADGQPVRWVAFDEQNRQIFRAVFFVESGPLGAIPNQVAAKAARDAFATWSQVPTAALRIDDLEVVAPDAIAPFKKDISAADFAAVQCDALGDPFPAANLECELIRACVNQPNLKNCPSPVIFDSDGAIFDLLLGDSGRDTLGFSGPVLALRPDPPPPPLSSPPLPPPLSILQSFAFLNGRFFDNDPNNSSGLDDPTGDRFLPGTLTHEFGHFLGLAHSVANGNVVAFNPALTRVNTAGGRTLDAPRSVDALVSVPLERVETMFPSALLDENQRSFTNSLEVDDRATLSSFYPCTAQARAAGSPCTQDFSASTGTIGGRVFIQNAARPAQGVVVVARRVNDPNNPDSALTDAVSQLTGNTFAPLRCFGIVAFDGDGDGNPDNNGDGSLDPNNPTRFGLFGACSTPTRGISAECLGQIRNLTFLDRKAFADISLLSCGFTLGFGFTTPRPIPSAAENVYQLTGLPPGEYIVQALQPIIGAFSSPVRSRFGPSTQIVSDDNVSTVFFPNPQTGEFYNGPPTGCGASGTACGNETGDRKDNPFAFTPIKVTGGGPAVENIDIFLNTSDSLEALLSDPGLDYCGLGDVDADGTVSENDIRAVAVAKAAFDKKGTLNKRADINADGQITFLDVDIVTDLVSIPQAPIALGQNEGEIPREIAPFDAICAAAKQGGCRIQAPQRTIGADGKPSANLCNFAASVGCQVVGCQ